MSRRRIPGATLHRSANGSTAVRAAETGRLFRRDHHSGRNRAMTKRLMAVWTWLVPALSFVLLIGALVAGVGSLLAAVCAAALIGAVFAAVHHAAVVAILVGEPYGTLILD